MTSPNPLYPVSFAIAANNEEVFRRNALASPDIQAAPAENLLIRCGYPCASQAYNSALDGAPTDIVVFLHQDVYLPQGWMDRLLRTMGELALDDQGWAVLGCFGISVTGREVGHVYCNGVGRELGAAGRAPAPVQSLDECLLVVRRSSGLRFDSAMPNYHLYGTDICLQARQDGFGCFAISNLCLHNTVYIPRLPVEFWECAEYIRGKWRHQLPVTTSCTRIWPQRSMMWLTRMNYELRALRNPPRDRDRIPDPAHFILFGQTRHCAS